LTDNRSIFCWSNSNSSSDEALLDEVTSGDNGTTDDETLITTGVLVGTLAISWDRPILRALAEAQSRQNEREMTIPPQVNIVPAWIPQPPIISRPNLLLQKERIRATPFQ
jgi:hypothetical protein